MNKRFFVLLLSLVFYTTTILCVNHRHEGDGCLGLPQMCESAAKLTRIVSFISKSPRDKVTLTIASPTSLNRLSAMEAHCILYKNNPHVVLAYAVYIPAFNGKLYSGKDAKSGSEKPVMEVVTQLQQWYEEQTQQTGCMLDMELWQEDLPELGNEWYAYPVNALRNKAMELVRTEVVAQLDGDFVFGPTSFPERFKPGSAMYESMLKVLRRKSVLVIPAWAFTSGDVNLLTAAMGSKEKLLNMTGTVLQFGEVWHAQTNYTKWSTAESMYLIMFPPKGMYEPYLLSLKKGMPCYDERFRGYFFNKAMYMYHTWRSGFKFIVHPEMYCMHLPHSSQEKRANSEVTAQKARLADHMRNPPEATGFIPFVKDNSCNVVF